MQNILHAKWIKSLLLFLLLFTQATLAKSAYISGLTESHSQTKLSLCAKVSRYFDSYNGVVAKPYISISPSDYFNVELSYKRICITGLKAETNYKVTIQKEVPLGAISLDKTYILNASTTSYTPSFSFPSRGNILAAKGEISIPVETINVEKLSVSLYRINTRNLMNKLNRYGLFRKMYSYELDKIEQTDGYKLWEKTLPIVMKSNVTQTTAIPVGKFLKKKEPGIYILHAKVKDEEDRYRYDSKIQWFMVSDIGMYTLQGDKGLQVYTKTLSLAKPYSGVTLELVSKNNEVLERLVTKKGKAFFPDALFKGKGGLEAKAIYAYGANGDFSVLDLSKSAHDLSDRGVTGRQNPGLYDAFVYSNRGIFKPTEEVTLHALVRNTEGKAESSLNLALKVFDSRGVLVRTKMLKTDDLGHVEEHFSIAETATTGRWHARLYLGSEKPIGSYAFLVEDFVPPKIKIDLTHHIAMMKPKVKVETKLEVKYLTGEALAHANVDVDTILHKAKHPFEGYESYFFGDIDAHFSNIQLEQKHFTTNAQGKLTLPLMIESNPQTTLPLNAHIDISVNELGGRAVHKVIETFYAANLAYIGLKPHFTEEAVDMNDHAVFDVAYLVDGKLSKGELTYRLVEEDIDWHWRSTDDDDWEFYETYSDLAEVKKGSIKISKADTATLTLPKYEWGSYRLEVRDSAGVWSSFRFRSGYNASASKASADKLPLAIDKKVYHVGDKVTVHITPLFTGNGMVSIAHHDILVTKEVKFKARKATTVTFKVKKKWGSSLYVLATAFKKQSKKLGANRAIGVVPFKVEHPEQKIEVRLEHIEKTASSSTVEVHIKTKKVAVSKEQVGKVHFTLAAVDVGVLNLSRFVAPDPLSYFTGQQKLGIVIRDIYAKLIETKGTHAAFEVGGDEDQIAIPDTLISNKRKVVALFKVGRLDAKGEATVKLDIPEYQGALKLMVVAWSKDAVGSSSSELIVKDSISAEYYMPSFIALEDKAETLLTIDFDEVAKAGKYEIVLGTKGGIHLAKEVFTFNKLTEGKETFSQKIEMFAEDVVEGTINLEVLKEGKVVSHVTWHIAVREKYPESHVRKMGLISKGADFNASGVVDPKIWKGLHDVTLTLSAQPLLPVASLKQELIDYSSRCAEQTTSRAMPWLFTSKSTQTDKIIEKAIERLMTYQKIDGGFGLWKSSRASVWVGAYVLDFLTRAKKAGYGVSQVHIDKGLNWLENHLNRWSDKTYKREADVYALYVLARSKRVLMSEILYYANAKEKKIASSISWAHLGATLAYVGEKKLALETFETAKEQLVFGMQSNRYYYANYGGNLRDEAGLVMLMKESKLNIDWQSLFVDLAEHVKKRHYYSTQEMSLLLRTAYSMSKHKTKTLKLSVANKVVKVKKNSYRLSAKRLENIASVGNESEGDIWYTLSFKASPIVANYSAIQNDGFTLRKNFYTLKGKEIDIEKLHQNDRVVVVIEGSRTTYNIENPLITDWVPAGFELENPHILGIDATTGLKWIGQQSKTDHVNYRTDRYEAALSEEKEAYFSQEEHEVFRVAYLMRAVTVGEYTLVSSKVEDMYQVHYRAFSDFKNQRVKIATPLQASKATKVLPVVTAKQVDKNSTIRLSEKDFLDVYQYQLETLSSYSIVQLNILRNSIFAHAGLNFEQSNPMLFERFSPYSWYKPTTDKSSMVYKSLSVLQKRNVQKLLDEEKRRAGGLVLADFYRVYHRTLVKNDIVKYSKKELRILRNSLLARFGYDYTKRTTSLHKIYSYMPWYKPTNVSASEVLDKQMPPEIKANVLLMLSLEKEKK